MATFKAINVDYEDESDVDVDDTKEIQIEEALKLYQTALKYHSEGLDHYHDAKKAYQSLFDSEIFTYPESHSLLRRIELYGPLVEPEELLLEEQHDLAVEAPVSTDNAPSTLPQILHLSHRNYGDFLLKRLFLKLAGVPPTADHKSTLVDLATTTCQALNHFVDALDKDETDLELWSDTSSLSELTGSQRIARFCLEAILQSDDDPFLDLVHLPALAQSMAGKALHRLVAAMPDALSLAQTPLSRIGRKREHRHNQSLQSTDVYSKLRHAKSEIVAGAVCRSDQPGMPSMLLDHPSDWSDFAETMAKCLVDDQDATLENPTMHYSIVFSLANEATILPLVPPLPEAIVNPASTLYQFPGLDLGLPTTINPPDVMQSLLDIAHTINDTKLKRPAIPSRKRSSMAAGLDEGDSGRSKRKSLRARESLIDASVLMTSAKVGRSDSQVEHDLDQIRLADMWAYEEIIDVFIGSAGAEQFDLGLTFKEDVCKPLPPEMTSKLGRRLPCYDMWQSVHQFDEVAIRILMSPEKPTQSDLSEDWLAHNLLGIDTNSLDDKDSPTSCDLDVRSPSMQTGLNDLITEVNGGCCDAVAVALRLVKKVLSTDQCEVGYLTCPWDARFKHAMMEIICRLDAELYSQSMASMQSSPTDLTHHQRADHPQRQFSMTAEATQSIFELLLDSYSVELHEDTHGSTEKDRLDRWAAHAQEATRVHNASKGTDHEHDRLTLRSLWTSVFYLVLSQNTDKDHLLACLRDLRRVFESSSLPPLSSPNNKYLQTMSVEVIDREISKLTTAEFFRTIFNTDNQDPIMIIEKLEPLLETLHRDSLDRLESTYHGHGGCNDSPAESCETRELLKLLRRNTALHLPLWKRIRMAYNDIKYTAMVTNCDLRMLEGLVADLDSNTYVAADPKSRRKHLYKTLANVQDILASLMVSLKTHKNCSEALDEDRLRSAMTALVRVLRLLYAFNLFDDEVRIESRSEPEGHEALFTDLARSLHGMELQAWQLMIYLFKEVFTQQSQVFQTPEDSTMELIRVIHRAVGMRNFCHLSNQSFLKFIKSELTNLAHVPGYEFEFPQIMYDLTGLRCFVNPTYDQLEHQSPCELPLDRETATQVAHLLLRQTADLKVADLYKHPLKEAIEKAHSVLSKRRLSEVQQINRAVLAAFLKSHILSLDLFRCLSGHSHLNMGPAVGSQNYKLACKGWYLLLSNSVMSRFIAQKKAPSGPQASDLEWAITYLRHDIEITGGSNWESWFRLGHALDAKIDYLLQWSAEKLNRTGRSEIIGLERSVIHCYMMAVALVERLEDSDFVASANVALLYGNFANRLYASSRSPFDMAAFSPQDTDKFTLGNADDYRTLDKIVRSKAHTELSSYTIWRIARVLFQRAIAGNPEKWYLHYMHGKCLWKMHTADEEAIGDRARLTYQDVMSAFTRSLELLPSDKKDSRKDPILEPHYKVISIMHKMVQRGAMHLKEARERLNAATPYARRAYEANESAPWNEYILAAVRSVQQADKSHWHHRITSRAARIIYNDDDGGDDGAVKVRDELTQHMFTKTMTLQVWKPEYERSGRHFVYTAIYTRFFVSMLEQLDDVTNLEQLAKRVRRRAADYLDFNSVWSELAMSYVGALRRRADIPHGHEIMIFSSLEPDEFAHCKSRLEAWCQDSEHEHKAFDTMRDAIEFKKTNGNLMKPSAIDDLIGDAYAVLYASIGQHFWTQHLAEQQAQAEAERREKQAAETKSIMSLDALMNEPSPTTVAAKGADTKLVLPARTPSPARAMIDGNQDEKTAPGSVPINRRKTGIGRREVRAAAEACLKTVTQPSKSVGSAVESTSRLQVVLPGRRRARVPSPTLTARSQRRPAIDSDDSELSEIDEELVNEGERVVQQGLGPSSRERSGTPPALDGTNESGDVFEGRSSPAPELDYGDDRGDDGDDNMSVVEETFVQVDDDNRDDDGDDDDGDDNDDNDDDDDDGIGYRTAYDGLPIDDDDDETLPMDCGEDDARVGDSINAQPITDQEESMSDDAAETRMQEAAASSP